MAKVYLSPSNQTDNRYAYGNTTEASSAVKLPMPAAPPWSAAA